jgi:aquaporin NIP
VGRLVAAPPTRPELWRRAIGEVIGTGMLVFGGCGAIVSNSVHQGTLGTIGIALAFFLVLLAAIAALGHISGAHFNPGVSVAFLVARHLPARDCLTYVVAQLVGATGAALLLHVVWPANPANLGATVPTIGDVRAVLVEFVLTAILMFVVMSMATDTRAVGAPAALAIAAVVGVAALAFGPVTGASLNTARSFGPALVSGEWQSFWIYIVGPMLGAPVGALLYQLIRGEHSPAPPLDTTEGPDGDRPVRLPA